MFAIPFGLDNAVIVYFASWSSSSISHQIVVEYSRDIEACATATATFRARYACDLELASDQLHGIINIAALEKFQAWLVHDNLGIVAVF